MLPLRDDNPRTRFPIVTYLLIALNVLAFLWELSLGPNLERALFSLAFIPARFWLPGHFGADLFTIVLSMFLHGGLLHIGSNMLYLFIFGDNVEDRLGPGKYLVFYLACGFLATLAHAFFSPGSRIPAIGASGAIAGVLGAYLVLFPRAQVTTLIPIFILITIRQIPAIIILGLWFVLQLFSGVGSLGVTDAQDMGGVAYFAHIGGFVAGLLLIAPFGGFKRPRRVQPPPPWWMERR
ncbi:MAG TPA: rhomboid family intramembrane serine protease [Thermoanaerobaculia bacterium]|jgi:membrane associated rhomboid family serine protease|nr:rhomboid family intramembrane serine protease [Thermoanaerobaculia bacterium]